MVALIVVSGLVVVRGEVGDFGPAVGGVLSWLLGIVLRVSLSMQSARLFSELRESGGLELMLTTPLRVGEILSGFWRHLRRKYLALVIGICVLQVVIAFASRKAGGGVQEMFWVWWVWWIWFVLYPVATLLGDCFAAGWVGMYLGLTVRRPGMAAGWAVLYGVILPTILMCIPRLLLTIPAAFWARDRLCNQLRALGAPR
jgi:hypothetical protein